MATEIWKYSEDDEQELIAAAQRGCKESMLVLMSRFEPMFLRMAARYASRRLGLSRDDVAQEARLGFIKCIQDFNITKYSGIHLSGWAPICVRNFIYNLIGRSDIVRTPTKHRASPYQHEIKIAKNIRRLHEVVEMAGRRLSKKVPICELLVDNSSPDPVKYVETKEFVAILKRAENALSKKQVAVVYNKINGTSFAEIGRVDGISRQAVEQQFRSSLRLIAQSIESSGLSIKDD